MNTITALFYVFSAVLLFASFRVITARSTVHAALYLVLAFFNAACVWMLLRAEFLAIALVLVYVGAVMVLFLFVVMMLDVNLAELRAGFASYLPVGLIVATAMVVALLTVVGGDSFGLASFPEPPAAAAVLPGGEAIAAEPLRCERCRTPHHRECWEYTGKCSIFGCGGDRAAGESGP